MIGLGVLAGAGAAASSAAAMNTTLPSISGTPQDGKTLTADNGSWKNGVSDYNYFSEALQQSGNSYQQHQQRPRKDLRRDLG